MKIESIPSCLPHWFDPNAPGFKKPTSWVGCRVKISIPVSVNPSQELADARTRLEKRYPGAQLHLVPEYTKTVNPVQSIDVQGTDDDLLRSYFSTVTLPGHVIVDQITHYIGKFIPSISVFGSKGLRFKSVLADNVLCFEHCEIDLDQIGLTLITGLNKDWTNRSNGSGKSSWTTLLFIALFGRTFKEQTHDEWASEFNDKTAKVTLVITLSDGRNLEIIRCRRPGSLRVYIDGKEVTMGTVGATQSLIEHVTNLTWEVLTNALYIGQSEIGSVFGTEKERKELFSRLLNLDRFLDAQSKLSKAALRIKRAAEAIENDIDVTESRIDDCTHSIDSFTERFNDRPKVSKKDVSKQTAEIERIKKSIDSKEADTYKLRTSGEVLSKELQKWHNKDSESRTRIKLTQKMLDSSHTAKDRCLVCGNKVDLKILKIFQDDLSKTIADENKNLVSIDLEKSKITAGIASINNQERILRQEVKSLQSTWQTIDESLSELKTQVVEQDLLLKTIKGYRSRICVLKRYKSIHEQAKQFTLEEKQFLDICVNAVSRNGLPAHLCEAVVPQLNTTAQHYSEVFAEGEIGIEFAASNGDVDIHVRNLHGGKLTKSQSEGEMRMASIVTAFTFRDALLQLNLLIVDEPSEGFDAENAQAFARGLTQVVDRFGHVMIISHNSNLVGSLEPDRRIEIIKENGISTARIVGV